MYGPGTSHDRDVLSKTVHNVGAMRTPLPQPVDLTCMRLKISAITPKATRCAMRAYDIAARTHGAALLPGFNLMLNVPDNDPRQMATTYAALLRVIQSV